MFNRVLVALVVGCAAAVANAAPPKSDVTAIQTVLQENFEASTMEDLPRLMATISSDAPDRDLFEKESRAVFARTDSYYRVDGFEMVGWKPPYAAARVVQTTTPKEEDDRQEGNVEYARGSALLPGTETVAYVQVFKKERGKWKLHEIVSKPEKIDLAALRQDSANCSTGQCGKVRGPVKGTPFR